MHNAKHPFGGVGCHKKVVNLVVQARDHVSKCNACDAIAPRPVGAQRSFEESLTSEPKGTELATRRFVFGSNLPFALVNNPTFRQMSTCLRPSVSGEKTSCGVVFFGGGVPGVGSPSAKAIGSTILDKVYTSGRQQFEKAHRGSMVTIAIDGWMTDTGAGGKGFRFISSTYVSTGIPIIGVTEDNALFECIEPTQPHTGQHLTDLAHGSIVRLEAECQCQAAGVFVE